jgi:CheY-like chemotaxis protein
MQKAECRTEGALMADHPEDERPTGEEEFIDRRSGVDRRAQDDRRHGGRRHRRAPVDDDRRSGSDRRRQSRRSGVDRRVFNDPRYQKPKPKVVAPSVYSTRDAARVQQIVSRVGQPARCPLCDGFFTFGPTDRRGTDVVRQVSCVSCGRGTVVRNSALARVMVVSRVDAISLMLRGALSGAGHEVVQPPTAAAALELYRENPPDVVVIEATVLTGTDGRGFIRHLRQEFPDPSIVVVAPRPSLGRADASAAAVGLGATHVLRTPFSRDDLLRVIRDARQS